ncbi:MAG TPA: PIG-L deacetylase family protein [Mycobacteriales bacterium]|nr:PIG-L deacetylase family protein [Mycobacteriales bacterium]
MRGGTSLAEVVMDDSAVERVLCVMAHPDDVDYGLAGTVAGWTDAGIHVTYCMVTSGDAGGFDPSVPRDQIAGIREREQRAAAKEVGVSDLHFLGYPDGQLEVSLDLRRDIARVIREVRPQRVVCQSPERAWERIYGSHPDHLAAGEATMCAVYPDARNPFTFADTIGQLEAWTVNEVWVSSGPRVNHYVDITKQFDRKKSALLRHESQMESAEKLHEILHFWNGSNAEAAGFPEGSYAEAFWVMDVT